jgi:hypothetical protein
MMMQYIMCNTKWLFVPISFIPAALYVTAWPTIINSEYFLFGLVSPRICTNWLLNYILLFDSGRVQNQALVWVSHCLIYYLHLQLEVILISQRSYR